MKLTVKEAYGYDTHKDTIRVHRTQRNLIRSGELVRVSVGGRSAFVAIRGLSDDQRGNILLDLETRRRLQVELEEVHDFYFSKIGFINKIRWAAGASDPAARIATGIAVWLGLLGVLLGTLSVILGLLPLLRR